jgi:N-carbamoylputrescine amidase
MTEKIKVAGVQVEATSDLTRNVNRSLEAAAIAVENGAKIICLPELFSLPWFADKIDKTAFENAQPIDGPVIEQCKSQAKDWGVYLIAPIFEKAKDGKFYNTAVVIDDSGEIAGLYRKMHIPQVPGWEERAYFSHGDSGFPVFEAFGVPFGVQISWDAFFPEGARALALAGAKLIFVPTANTNANDDLWQMAVRNNAFVNGCYCVRVNRVGEQDDQRFAGGSFCAAPTGDLLEAPMGEVEGLGLWTIDPEAVDYVRREWPFLRDRRPDQYASLTEQKPEAEKSDEPETTEPEK